MIFSVRPWRHGGELREPATNLHPRRGAARLLVDTSLDSSLLESTIDFVLTTTGASLRQFGPSLGDSLPGQG